jgi:hypothetical protein
VSANLRALRRWIEGALRKDPHVVSVPRVSRLRLDGRTYWLIDVVVLRGVSHDQLLARLGFLGARDHIRLSEYDFYKARNPRVVESYIDHGHLYQILECGHTLPGMVSPSGRLLVRRRCLECSEERTRTESDKLLAARTRDA